MFPHFPLPTTNPDHLEGRLRHFMYGKLVVMFMLPAFFWSSRSTWYFVPGLCSNNYQHSSDMYEPFKLQFAVYIPSAKPCILEAHWLILLVTPFLVVSLAASSTEDSALWSVWPFSKNCISLYYYLVQILQRCFY